MDLEMKTCIFVCFVGCGIARVSVHIRPGMCWKKNPWHGATSLLFLLRLLLKITLVYTYKNHMMRIRRRIMGGRDFFQRPPAPTHEIFSWVGALFIN